jgi:UDP-N-acetylmuramoyl-tripeptide--D-alanyl-D-alanine ligase
MRFGTSLYWRALRPAYDVLFWYFAVVWRRVVLRNVAFVGVTGSAGKTSTKQFIGAVLSTTLKGRVTLDTANHARDVARSISVARPGHQFRVVEVAAYKGPDSLDRPVWLLRPTVAVVTNVGTDHISAFGGSRDAIAVEKRKLVQGLSRNGVAILNADDPRVAVMREGLKAKVVTYGLHPAADVRGERVASRWPDRLSFDVVYGGERVTVQTLLCGRHWVSSALAAIAAGIALGVPLEVAARGLAGVPPFTGRMSPLTLPDGVTVIRDDYKASIHTVAPSLEFLKEARATRKIAILGTLADTTGESRITYVRVARQALDSADVVCFVGPNAFLALRAKTGADRDRFLAFGSVKAAADYFRDALRAGDLVLLKGSNTADHLYRIFLSRTTLVACWQAGCGRQAFCNVCRLVSVPSDPPAGISTQVVEQTDSPPSAAVVQVIVGLGNPGNQYQNTPHNVGHAVVDRLAGSMGVSEWGEEPEGRIARGEWHGERVWLLKPNAWMNQSGDTLRDFARRVGLRPEQCILVFDDHDLPLGTVRVRMRGSDGGHRGVRSVLEAFQTDQFRRVKIGVRRDGLAQKANEAILTPFTSEQGPTVEKALNEAMTLLGELVVPPRPRGNGNRKEPGKRQPKEAGVRSKASDSAAGLGPL